jgi:GAF domain-containing protein
MTSPLMLPSYKQLADAFAAIAKRMIAAPDLEQAFTTIVELGISMVPGAQHGGITILRHGTFETPVASGDLPRTVDAIQYAVGTGPCVDAVLDDTMYRSGDISRDTRWPEFGGRAADETGVRSMLSFPLYLENDSSLGGLNFYSTETNAFAETATAIGTVFATHAAIALAAAQRQATVTNLYRALESSREIGTAMGILMTRELLTRDQAFDLLRLASQRSHRKLRAIASEIVDTGMLDLPSA